MYAILTRALRTSRSRRNTLAALLLTTLLSAAAFVNVAGCEDPGASPIGVHDILDAGPKEPMEASTGDASDDDAAATDASNDAKSDAKEQDAGTDAADAAAADGDAM
jgi:hypothetical protein